MKKTNKNGEDILSERFKLERRIAAKERERERKKLQSQIFSNLTYV
jgi:hypothetical protein